MRRGSAGADMTALAGKSVDASPDGRPRFFSRNVAGARLLIAKVPPIRIAQVADGGREAPPFHLVIHIKGAAIYRHEQGQEEIGPGVVALVDAARTCSVEHPDGARVICWDLPRASVAPLLPAAAPCVTTIEGPICGIVMEQALALARSALRLEQPAQQVLVDQLALLVGFAATHQATKVEPAAPRASEAAINRQRIGAYLEAHFREPTLTVARAARDLGMSRRWLQVQIIGHGAGFSDLIRTRRLDDSLARLRDPAAAHLTVTEIAFAAGFNDLSTFHRQFRRRFGMTPRAARGSTDAPAPSTMLALPAVGRR
jgi:AraC-like DNA-binding protein